MFGNVGKWLARVFTRPRSAESPMRQKLEKKIEPNSSGGGFENRTPGAFGKSNHYRRTVGVKEGPNRRMKL